MIAWVSCSFTKNKRHFNSLGTASGWENGWDILPSQDFRQWFTCTGHNFWVQNRAVVLETYPTYVYIVYIWLHMYTYVTYVYIHMLHSYSYWNQSNFLLSVSKAIHSWWVFLAMRGARKRNPYAGLRKWQIKALGFWWRVNLEALRGVSYHTKHAHTILTLWLWLTVRHGK